MRSLAMLFVACATPCALFAQSAPQDDWHYVIEPYVMFPTIDGTVGIKNLPDVSLSKGPSDLFSHLQFGAMLYLEAHNNDWAVTSDLLYANVAETAPSRPVVTYARADLKELLWQPAVLYRMTPWLQAGLGADLTYIQSGLNVTVNTPLGSLSDSGSRSLSWVDPAVIVRGTFPVSQRWSVMLQGSVGGFDVNSKLIWGTQLYGAYRITDLVTFFFGYRAIGDNYETGNGTSRFLYNATMFGPVLRVAFTL